MKQWIEKNLDGGKVVKESVAGSSSWSSAYTYHTESGKKFFIKLSPGRDSSMFEGEALGLQALYGTYLNHLLTLTTGAAKTHQVCPADAKSMRIPKIYHFGSLSSVPEGEANCVAVCLYA